MSGGGKERAKNGRGLLDGGDVGGGASLGSGKEASATKLDGKKRLIACWVGETSSEEARESRELEDVKIVVDGAERLGVARAKTVCHFGEGVAMTQQAVFQLRIVEEVKIV